MKNNKTVNACFTAYIVQAIVNNFVPLLFLTFNSQYKIPLSQITALVTINFIVQLIIDVAAVTFVDKIGYRISTVLAHILSALGIISLTFLPELLPNAFVGLLISIVIYAVGGGLLEVLISPIVEATPSDNKEKTMSLLHSFYCWGHVGVVLVSTVFFFVFGIKNWKILALVWAAVPIVNAVVFTKVPIYTLIADGEKGLSIKALAKMKTFWIMVLLMICAGASEQSVSQWASTFAEKGLSVSKTVGDLAGPMAFAVFMGTARMIYGKFGEKIPLKKFMTFSAVLCIFSYLLISLSPSPVFGLLGCSVCGFSVGIFWPGTFSTASAAVKNGGTALFALLALAGDLGCSAGPSVVGFVSGAFDDNLKIGILAATAFPSILLILLLFNKNKKA